jgi:hypothetical protein
MTCNLLGVCCFDLKAPARACFLALTTNQQVNAQSIDSLQASSPCEGVIPCNALKKTGFASKSRSRKKALGGAFPIFEPASLLGETRNFWRIHPRPQELTFSAILRIF